MKLLAFIFEQPSYVHFNGLKLSGALKEFSDLWLSFVVSNCEFVTFPLVSWARCGT